MTDPGGRRDGAAVCPFVAFAEDRDRRASEPDSHHRCYAEDPPAPRAIGHQETFCLTPNFAGCPTFVDWAKRQAAHTAPVNAVTAAAATSGAQLLETALEDAAAPAVGRRRDVSPPWLAETPSGQLSFGGSAAPAVAAPPAGDELGGGQPDRADAVEPLHGEPEEPPTRLGAGAGAAAIAALSRDPGGGDSPQASPSPEDDVAPPAFLADRARAQDEGPHGVTRFSDRNPSREQARVAEPARRGGAAPGRETRRRPDAYPQRRRDRLPPLSPVLIGLIALLVAALVLFVLPSLLTNPPSIGLGPSGSPEGSPTAPPSPTASPLPTPQQYTVVSGDTLTSIAAQFGVTVDEVLAANPQIGDPDALQIGDVLTIPVPGSGSPSPSGATSPAP
jgi:nucleoid-associated protein YgaU